MCDNCRVNDAGFDVPGIFNEDYLWFYEQLLAERSTGDVEEIEAALDLERGASILDAPCGHGRLSNLLAAHGFRVTGVDITRLFLERARADAEATGVDVDYRSGDLRRLPTDGPFDAVVCWFTSFGYFDDDGNQEALAEFARVLRPGGKLLIETMHHDGFVRNHPPEPAATVFRRGDDLMVDVTRFDPVSGRATTERTVVRDGTVRQADFVLRLPTVPELDGWLAAAGYSHRSYTDRAGAPLTTDSWRLVVTATKGG